MLRCHTANFDIVHVHVDVSYFELSGIRVSQPKDKTSISISTLFLGYKSPLLGNERGIFLWLLISGLRIMMIWQLS